jgi:hypothetical protein
MPPAAVNSAVSRAMNGMYSATSVWARALPAAPGPKTTAKGSRKASAQPAAILPKWWCHNLGAASGRIAIDSRTPANGMPHHAARRLPSISAAWASRGKAKAMEASAERRWLRISDPGTG